MLRIIVLEWRLTAFSCLKRQPRQTFNWHSFSFDYTATSTSALLSLEAQINGTDDSYEIDNISMEAVPEPNSLCLVGVGGIISAMFFKNRRKI